MSEFTDRYQCRPYGAIELKMTYQRNMLIANAMVMTLITTMLVSVWALTSGNELVVIPPLPDNPRDSIRVVWTDGDNITIIREQGGGQPSAPSDAQGWNLVPVDDRLIIEDRPLNTEGGFGVSDGPGEPLEHEFGYSALPGGEPADAIPEYGAFTHVEKEPVMVIERKPEYPSLARRLGLEGKVIVGALVWTDGKVREAKVVRSSGSDALDSAAVEAAYLNIYSPGIQNGRAIPVWVTYTVKFTLEE